jgi:hypothetical protein
MTCNQAGYLADSCFPQGALQGCYKWTLKSAEADHDMCRSTCNKLATIVRTTQE